MRVLKEDSPSGRKLNALEEFLRINNIRISPTPGGLGAEIDGKEYEVRDTDSRDYSSLPRTFDSERFVLYE